MGMSRLQIRSGTVIGSAHKRKGLNNQDAHRVLRFELKGRHYSVGVVSDGCTGDKGGKLSHTETGAHLLAEKAVNEVRWLITTGVSLAEIPKALYPRLVSYVGTIAWNTVSGTPAEVWEFIQSHFLATVVGFVADEQTLVPFVAGDGVIVRNDRITLIDQNDRPGYLAYHQVSREILGDAAALLPQGFESVEIPLVGLKRFLVATDGLARRQRGGAPILPPGDVDALLSYEPDAPKGLQWWLNKQAADPARFEDDCTVISVEPQPERGASCS